MERNIENLMYGDAVVLNPGTRFIFVLGNCSRTVHKIWPNADRKPEAKVFLTPGDARFFVWKAAEDSAVV